MSQVILCREVQRMRIKPASKTQREAIDRLAGETGLGRRRVMQMAGQIAGREIKWEEELSRGQADRLIRKLRERIN